MNTKHLDILKHSLGWPKNYRNYFSAEVGSADYVTCRELVVMGYMIERASPVSDDRLFHVTPTGKTVLAQPDAPKET